MSGEGDGVLAGLAEKVGAGKVRVGDFVEAGAGGAAGVVGVLVATAGVVGAAGVGVVGVGRDGSGGGIGGGWGIVAGGEGDGAVVGGRRRGCGGGGGVGGGRRGGIGGSGGCCGCGGRGGCGGGWRCGGGGCGVDRIGDVGKHFAGVDVVGLHEVGNLVGGEGVVEDPEFVDGAVEGGFGVGLEADGGGAGVGEDVGGDFAGGFCFAGFIAVEIDGEGGIFGAGFFPDPCDVVPDIGGNRDAQDLAACADDVLVGGVLFVGFVIAESGGDFAFFEAEEVGVGFLPVGEEVVGLLGVGEFDPGGDGEGVVVKGWGERGDGEAAAAGAEGNGFAEGGVLAVVEGSGGGIGDERAVGAVEIGEGVAVLSEFVEGPVGEDVGVGGRRAARSKEQEARRRKGRDLLFFMAGSFWEGERC